MAVSVLYDKNKYIICKFDPNLIHFDFSKEGLKIVSPPYFCIVSPPYFCMVFQENFFSWSILFTSAFTSEILGNIWIPIICFLRCHAINFETNLIFLIKPFFYMTEKSRQTFKYLKNEKIFFKVK